MCDNIVKYFVCDFCEAVGTNDKICAECADTVQELNVIGAIGICNTASMNIYKIGYGIDDKILAGINNEKPEWYTVETIQDEEDADNYVSAFRYGDTLYLLSEAMRMEGIL